MKKSLLFAVTLLLEGSAICVSAQSDLSVVEASQTLLPVNMQASGQFGWASAMSADQLFVGQYRATDAYANAGKVFVYNKSAEGWVLADSILSPRQEIGSCFGYSIATDGEHLIIGGSESFVSTSKDGFVAIYAKDASTGKWVQEGDVLSLPTTGLAGQFGAYSAIKGNVAVAGAYLAKVNGVSSVGVAAIMERGADGTWSLTEISSPTPTVGNVFGRAVAVIDDNNVLIGSAKAGVWRYAKGSDGWTIAQTFDVKNTASQMSIAVDGGNMIINNYSNNKAFAYAQQADGSWAQTQEIAMPESASKFGNIVAISGQKAVITVPSGGNAYLYELADGAWSPKAALQSNGATTFGNFLAFNGTDAAISVATQAVTNAAGANVTNVGTVFSYDLSSFSTAIGSIAEAGKALVKTVAGGIVITAEAPTAAAVYGIDGRLAAQLTAAAGETRVALPKGVYIVRIGATSVKVAL